MNLKDRRKPEKKPPEMSGSLLTGGSRNPQNWSDTTEKYRMLLAEQSETICTQKDTISEQEKIIRQQVSDIREKDSRISELKSSLEQGRIDMSKTENNLREQHESELSKKDSLILQAQNLAQDGCYYPQLSLEQKTDYVIGKYGIMRGEYMMKYQRHEYLKMIMDGT